MDYCDNMATALSRTENDRSEDVTPHDSVSQCGSRISSTSVKSARLKVAIRRAVLQAEADSIVEETKLHKKKLQLRAELLAQEERQLQVMKQLRIAEAEERELVASSSDSVRSGGANQGPYTSAHLQQPAQHQGASMARLQLSTEECSASVQDVVRPATPESFSLDGWNWPHVRSPWRESVVREGRAVSSFAGCGSRLDTFPPPGPRQDMWDAPVKGAQGAPPLATYSRHNKSQSGERFADNRVAVSSSGDWNYGTLFQSLGSHQDTRGAPVKGARGDSPFHFAQHANSQPLESAAVGRTANSHAGGGFYRIPSSPLGPLQDMRDVPVQGTQGDNPLHLVSRPDECTKTYRENQSFAGGGIRMSPPLPLEMRHMSVGSAPGGAPRISSSHYISSQPGENYVTNQTAVPKTTGEIHLKSSSLPGTGQEMGRTAVGDAPGNNPYISSKLLSDQGNVNGTATVFMADRKISQGAFPPSVLRQPPRNKLESGVCNDQLYNGDIPKATSRSAGLDSSRSNENLEKQQRALFHSLHLPKLELPTFNGDPLQYWNFIRAFDNTVGNVESSDAAKLARLLMYCEGRARRTIEGCSVMEPSAGYRYARKMLKDRFGDNFTISEAWIQKVVHGDQIRGTDSLALRDFSDDIKLCQETLKAMDMINEIDTQRSIVRVVEKLPNFLQARWRKQATSYKRIYGQYPHFDKLVDFITEAADEANDPLFGGHAGDKYKQNNKRRALEKSAKHSSGGTFYASTTGDVKSVQAGLKSKSSSKNCVLCKEQHKIWTCLKFNRMPVRERWTLVKKHKLCFICLSDDHSRQNCKWNKLCDIDHCGKGHNRLLHEQIKHHQAKKPTHGDEQIERETIPTAPPECAVDATLTTVEKRRAHPSFAMRTVPVKIKNKNRILIVNALLDEASSRTFINSDVANELGMDGEYEELHVSTLNDSDTMIKTTNVKFTLSSMDGKTAADVSAYTVKDITGNMTITDWCMEKKNWPHLRGLEFPPAGPRTKIDLLIGLDHAELMFSEQDIKGQIGEPLARKTPLGWTCVSGNTTHCGAEHTLFVHQCSADDERLEQSLRRYWEIEEFDHTLPLVKKEETAAISQTEMSISHSMGRYCVGVPWRENKDTLSDNYDTAVKRLSQIEKRLNRDCQLRTAYSDVLSAYHEKGYVRRLEGNSINDGWYLPHFPVLRPDKATTKIRIVFDASARHDGISLNDVIYTGPKLQNELLKVLLRFRRHMIAISCDVAEMYLQIMLKEDDRKYFRFLWRDNPEADLSIYEWSRVVFGVNASPFLAQYVSRYNADQMKNELPLAADTVLNSTYMDDSLDSVEDVETAKKLVAELQTMWGNAGMLPRKWLSNKVEVMSAIPPTDCAAEIDLDSGALPTVKTLGMWWSATDDEFGFRITEPEDRITQQLSKRKFLKKIATLFDPLGFLHPFTIRAKLIFQEMWVAGVSWDEEVPPELSAKAKSWFDELRGLSNIKISRCLKVDNAVVSASLHVFTDASKDAYGAAVYALYVYESENISCHLVTAKAKVTPLRAVSIPRAELMGAVIGARLAGEVSQSLDIADVTLWTDSMNVLHWIHGQSKNFKPFVAHRVGEIHEKSAPSDWRYVQSKKNPADLLTRGLPVHELENSSLWWHGPSFLKDEPSTWPERPQLSNKDVGLLETRAHTYATVHIEQHNPEESRLSATRFSSWKRLTRVTGYVLRFIRNCQVGVELRAGGALTAAELSEAELHHIKLAQAKQFREELTILLGGGQLTPKSKLRGLLPFIDEDGILRAQGRISLSSSAPWNMKYPIILPRSHPVTSLIVLQFHEEALHHGVNFVLSKLTQMYWVPSAREVIREVAQKCVICARRRAKPVSQVMAPLPQVRSTMSIRAFAKTSIDFAGPFIVKIGRGRTRLKRYLCVFSCLTTRAIHLEVAFGLDIDCLLRAFDRMFSRRGVPEEIIQIMRQTMWVLTEK